MKKAIILTYYRFPNGDAGSLRQLAFAKLLQSMGFETIVIGMGRYLGNKPSFYQDIEFYSFRNSGNSTINRFHNFFGYTKKLRNIFKTRGKFDLILVVDLPLTAMIEAKKYAIKNNSILIHDSVEWYSPSEFKTGFLSPEYLRKDLKNRFFFKKPWKIIGISSFLTSHFKSKGLDTCRIPVVFDLSCNSFCKECRNDSKTVIMYAGSPLKKDYFDQIVFAVELLDDKTRNKLEFKIFGITENDFKASLSINENRWHKLNNTIHCYGKVDHETIIKNLRSADYTILIRDANQRYAKAGFPTKVPESLSNGTPVICNLSSDLELYLNDMDNSIIVPGITADSIKTAIKKAVEVPSDKKKEMQQKAFETAQKYFNVFDYEHEFRELIATKGNK